MLKDKIIYIIPGYGETVKDNPYPELAKYLKSKNYFVKFYEPKWKYNTISKWVKDFNSTILSDKFTNPAVLGFSIGALITILEAKNHQFSKIILCSIPALFKEDIKFSYETLALRSLGTRRVKEFKKNVFPKYLITPAIFMSGSLEIDSKHRGSKDFYRIYRGKKRLYIISEAGHDISNPNYLGQIKKLFQ